MLLDRFISFAQKLEDPNSPLLGPYLKALNCFGLWKTRSWITNYIFISSVVFVMTQIIDFYESRGDINKALCNFSLTSLSVICIAKSYSFITHRPFWKILVENVSREEVTQIIKQNPKTLSVIQNYTRYSRFISYSYWIMVALTNVGLIVAPLIRYLTVSEYRENIAHGIETYPHIINSWFPFDDNAMPGYVYASAIQIIMSVQGSGVLASYDTTTIAIMIFIKGQMIILRNNCVDIFRWEKKEINNEFIAKIKECHRHHEFLMRQFKQLNDLMSPTMSLYVLLCSITLCCSVVQFISKEVTTSQKLWVIQYSTGQIFQLFLFFWHANDMFVESQNIDGGVFASDWWKADVRMRKQIILLAGKLNYPMILRAGPFAVLSLSTFFNIIKRSYSFFTLISQMQD